MSPGSLSPKRKGWLSLAELDQLDLEDVAELTGLEQDVVRVLVDARQLPSLPCTPSALVSSCEQPELRGEALLPEGFVDAIRARERDDRWRDDLIAALRARGLADALVDYAGFQALTTFDVEGIAHCAHTSPDDGWYALRRDDAGVVIGIEAGVALRDTNVEGDFQRRAHLRFPVALEQLVRWVRDQGGDVALKTDDVDEIARVPTVTSVPCGSVPSGTERRTRADPMSLEIERALEEVGDQPAKVKEWLAKQAGKDGSCVLSVATDGIIWKDSVGEKQKLGWSALRKRLKRMRDRHSEAR
jgi:hypothetical protein